MAKDRMFFLFSIVFLGIVAAFLFRPATLPSVHMPEEQANGKAPSLEVLVALKGLKPGDHLDTNSVKWEIIENKEFNPSYIIKNGQTENSITGAIVEKPIAKGEKIKHYDILWPQDIQHNESAVPVLPPLPGKRAVPYLITQKSGLIQFLAPGMFVDVSFTSKSNIGFGTVAVTLLKHIRILAVGKEPDAAKSMMADAGTEILLEMAPRQAEVFSYAEQTGNITLNLVQPSGYTPNDPPPGSNDQLAGLLMKSESVSNFQSVLVTYMMRRLFPGVDVEITATEKGYIVSGKVPDPQIAGKIMEILIKLAPGGDKAIVDLMEVNPQQVLVSVKVFEVSRDFIVNLGINWEAIWSNNGAQIAFGSTYPPANPLDPNFFFNWSETWGKWNLSALLNMLQEDNVAVVLADPNLTTVSGQTAHFFAGGEFPILIPQGGQLLGTVTVEYKQYGVLLDVTPIVDLNGLISLRIRPEVSDIDKANSVILSGFVIPGLKSRYADTMVKLWPGQSYIIGGLLSDLVTDKEDTLYGFDKLPIIGPLFRSTAYEDQRTELLIIVTPYLVNSDRMPDNIPIEINRGECCQERARLIEQGLCVEPKEECRRARLQPVCDPEPEVYTQWEE